MFPHDNYSHHHYNNYDPNNPNERSRPYNHLTEPPTGPPGYTSNHLHPNLSSSHSHSHHQNHHQAHTHGHSHNTVNYTNSHSSHGSGSNVSHNLSQHPSSGYHSSHNYHTGHSRPPGPGHLGPSPSYHLSREAASYDRSYTSHRQENGGYPTPHYLNQSSSTHGHYPERHNPYNHSPYSSDPYAREHYAGPPRYESERYEPPPSSSYMPRRISPTSWTSRPNHHDPSLAHSESRPYSDHHSLYGSYRNPTQTSHSPTYSTTSFEPFMSESRQPPSSYSKSSHHMVIGSGFYNAPSRSPPFLNTNKQRHQAGHYSKVSRNYSDEEEPILQPSESMKQHMIAQHHERSNRNKKKPANKIETNSGPPDSPIWQNDIDDMEKFTSMFEGLKLQQKDINLKDAIGPKSGKCKWFNVEKGFGFITPDQPLPPPFGAGTEPKDIFVYQNVIQMAGFRSLKDGEEVLVWIKKSNLGWEAVKCTGPSGTDCEGTERFKPKKPDRCYNCGDLGHHAKECSEDPMPKRCHFCKSQDHLVADCPIKQKDEKTHISHNGNTNGSNGIIHNNNNNINNNLRGNNFQVGAQISNSKNSILNSHANNNNNNNSVHTNNNSIANTNISNSNLNGINPNKLNSEEITKINQDVLKNTLQNKMETLNPTSFRSSKIIDNEFLKDDFSLGDNNKSNNNLKNINFNVMNNINSHEHSNNINVETSKHH